MKITIHVIMRNKGLRVLFSCQTQYVSLLNVKYKLGIVIANYGILDEI